MICSSSSTKVSVALGVEVEAIDFSLPALEQISVNLHIGYNQFGFTVLPQNLPSPYKASQLIKDMAAQGIAIKIAMQWDDGWAAHQVDLPFTDFNLNLDQGIFVSTISSTYHAGTWTMKGRKIKLPKAFNLTQGWNLVNTPTTISAHTAIQALQQINSQGGTADVMMWWDGDGWVATQIDLPFTDQQIMKEKSYFIRCANKSVWSIE